MNCARPRGAPAGGTDLAGRESDVVARCIWVGDGWQCRVEVDRSFRFDVDVARPELKRYAPGDTDPTELVVASVRFLLEREPPTSILAHFSLSVIERYFPDYPADIRVRMAALANDRGRAEG